MAWKIIERACVLLGALFAAATLYYTVAAYYGWNQPITQPSALPPMSTPWWLYILGSLGVALLITAWLMISIRSRKQLTAPSTPATNQIYDYSDDPEAEATDKQAYKEILAFALDRVIPACEAETELQDAIISQASGGNTVIASLAHIGIHHSERTKEFREHYTPLVDGLLASPGPIIRFEAIIEHIAALENGNYMQLSEQLSEFAVIFSMNVRTDANLNPIWLKWVEAHNALIEAYDPIKRDPRFGKLLRPARPSRWGDCIQIDSAATAG